MSEEVSMSEVVSMSEMISWGSVLSWMMIFFIVSMCHTMGMLVSGHFRWDVINVCWEMHFVVSNVVVM